MALLPVMMSDLLEDPWRPLFDQHFGMGLLPTDLASPVFGPLTGGYYRPWRLLSSATGGFSKIENNKDSFKVHLDVQQFKPEEIKVKVVDNFLQVEGKHEERKDPHGFISREFTRRYALPEGVDLESVNSAISSDGILTISAPKKALPEPNERVIPIIQTNTPALAGKTESIDKTDAGISLKDLKI